MQYAIPLGRECFGDPNKKIVQGQKSLISIINALNSLFEQGMKPTFLIGDDEKGFCSQETNDFFKFEWNYLATCRKKIWWMHLYYMNQTFLTIPLYSSLGIVERINYKFNLKLSHFLWISPKWEIPLISLCN